ncbi:MAG: M20 family metallopeptidase [bacterium]|nr:M20 family metallopeptidase [bacterium]
MTELKKEICEAIEAMRGDLISVSREIHANPELSFEEFKAAELLADTGRRGGLDVEVGVYGLDTALQAEFGDPNAPCVALLSEYDALPEIGHACGHNLIATSALGASLVLAALGERLPGRVRWLGTPAEEHGGGKELMAREGAFDRVDAALMIHPAGINLVTMPCIAIAYVEVSYHGRAAHASAMPSAGINALDALVIAYQAIGALRQHIKVTERLHGIITNGGQAANIVPELAKGSFVARAADASELALLKKRVEGCLRSGAEATGARLEMEWGDVDYMDLNTSWPLAKAFQANAESLGRDFFPFDKLPAGIQGSTDMGNVSHRLPSIHPMIASAPPNCTIHNAEFTEWSGGEMGDAALIDGAKALAMTALDFLCDETLRKQAAEAFKASTAGATL